MLKRYIFKPSLSIIVPAYNAAQTLPLCLDSILNKTKTRIEIICVDDGSTDETGQVLSSYQKRYKRIRVIKHDRNRGLFVARLSGVNAARADYIGFVDADDYVKEGYFDLLYQAAVYNHADISVGTVINQNADGTKYLQTRSARFPYTFSETDETAALYDMYWKQSGRCYHWHVIWNKIYRKHLWDGCISFFGDCCEDTHLTMLEDFVFSSILLKDVTRYAVETGAWYYYVDHPKASTKGLYTYQKISQNLLDMKKAFALVESFLLSEKGGSKYLSGLFDWKQRYCRIWKRHVLQSDMELSEMQESLDKIRQIAGGVVGRVLPEDEYYYGEIKAIVE